jgi:hypothetical protein
MMINSGFIGGAPSVRVTDRRTEYGKFTVENPANRDIGPASGASWQV